MRRPWQIWLTFAVCLAIIIGAVGWLSVKAVQAEAAANERAALEVNAREALWRMDSFLTPIVAQENSRPYFMYRSFYSADQVFGRMGARKGESDVSVPSPLLTQASPYVTLHFQFDPENNLTSPEVPQGKLLAQAVPAYLSDEQVRDNRLKIIGVQKVLTAESLLARLPPVETATTLPALPTQTLAQQVPNSSPLNAGPGNALNQNVQTVDPNPEANSPPVQQQARAQTEQRAQVDLQYRQRSFAQSNTSAQNYAFNNEFNNPFGQSASDVQMSMMTPLWLAGDLVLARRVSQGGRDFVQGCVLNWPAIKEQLKIDVADLLPHADLQPVSASVDASDVRRLASLPVQLIPGSLAMIAPAVWSPIQQSLLLAGIAMALAAAAVAALLRGVLSLSERRAAFVSAVTHELRTPLTTFRMYAEMLSAGMVQSDADRRQYLETLRVEADRLTHLVENVLAYARLERGRPGGRIETMSVERLLNVATQRLADRATQADLKLSIEPSDDVMKRQVQADPAAVEQILFNLVDNACKYAASSTDRTLHLSAAAENGRICIRLRDHGAGVSPAEQKRLFQPFRKSARDAAHSAPGVGLGLALSQRLARDMNGDLRCEPCADGACFALALPSAERCVL